MEKALARNDLAIIGMACRFPGSSDLASFWRGLIAGHSAFGDVPADRWNAGAFFNTHARAVDKTYSKRLAAIDDIRSFAPAFFAITPKRARVMDPQQRLLLECARLAVEDAGYARRALPAATTGVYVGVSVSEHKDIVTSRLHVPLAANGAYGEAGGSAPSAQVGRVPAFHAYTMVGQLLNMNAANISHAFDFGGPSFAIDTACSSSLVALHEAMLHLRLGLVDAAVVGGVYLNLDPVSHVCFSRIGALSRRGVCAPFSDQSDGFVLGEGAGVLVLKRAADAAADGDRIWAIVKGAAVNNDARADGPMTPSRAGQVAVMRRAYRDAGVDPAEVTMIEAHGTGTAAGDRTEIEALGDVFGGAGQGRVLTSTKANVGHALAASGLASVIKTALALHHGVIPRQANFATARPDLDLPAAGLRVPTATEAWQGSRCAGVSSFGFGGTNAHVVMSAPASSRRAPRVLRGGVPGDGVSVVVSAPTPKLLDRHREALASAVEALPADVALADVAYTLATRRVDRVQATIAAATMGELAAALRSNPVAVTAGNPEACTFSGCRVVSLPGSLLETAPYWVVEDANDQAAADSMPAPRDAELTRIVLEAIARVSAYPVEQLALDQSLGDQLGFDSLMSAELASDLIAQFPVLDDHASSLFERSLTVGGLIDRAAPLVGPLMAGAVAPATAPSAVTPAAMQVSLNTHPWLADHMIDGVPVVPMALMVDLCLDAVRAAGLDTTLTLADFVVHRRIVLDGESVWLRCRLGEGAVEVESAAVEDGPWSRACSARVESAELDAPIEYSGTLPLGPLSMAAFYRDHAFHGPRLQAVASVSGCSPTMVEASVRDTGIGGAYLPIALLDGALQAAAYWASVNIGATALPVSVRRLSVRGPFPFGQLRCLGRVVSRAGAVLTADLDLVDDRQGVVAQLRGLQAHTTSSISQARATQPAAEWQIESFPEVQALKARKTATAAAGLKIPYFTLHDDTARGTSRIGGREMLSFSTYNYLGLSGDPAVTEAAIAAVQRYGTTVSASRIAAGERPVHRDLESAIARFLGCDDAITFVGGHATNVTTIGHLVGPQDLVLYDALAHDSIIGGARQSGARHRSFAHNNLAALDRLLKSLRGSARRVLICVEGVYSMDGDLAPLDRMIELKRRHRALLLVDEAHSLGVLGGTGRGAGEHFGIERGEVDLWMGTLSKSLASCGGYIAGSAGLIDYLKFSAPGFVYSCGLSPANAAAALAAIQAIEARPELVTTLRARAELFRSLARAAGIDCGLSQQSAVVPCIIGRSDDCLRLAASLDERGIAVHPIIYPAVEEAQARLRFFVSLLHTEQQIRGTVEILAEELAALGGLATAVGGATQWAS